MIVYVRAKKDRDAIEHMFRRFYGYVPRLETLGGERHGLEEIISAIEPKDFTLVLLGREDRKWVEGKERSAWKKVEFFDKAKIRNGRMHQLFHFFERAKLRFVFDVNWEGTYVLGEKTAFIRDIGPGQDLFLAYWKEYQGILSRMVGGDVGTPLVQHKGNTDVLYAGSKVLATIDREGLVVRRREKEPVHVDVDTWIRKNREHVEEKVRVTLEKIRRILDGFDDVVVPFSGGKDSTTVALLLKEAGIEFTPVFVDTGAEYEETLAYVDYMERVLGRMERVEAPVAKKARALGEEYLRRRVCTRDKISTLYAFVRSSFERPILVNGDRIVESKARSLRPEVRKDEFFVFSPIRLWSFMDEQLYLLTRGVEINPLYKRGFYRVGCSFCPFTDTLERVVSGYF